MAARGGAGLGQQELAALLGVSQAAVSDYERGRRRPGLAMLVEIARHLGVEAGWLLTGAASEANDHANGERHPAGTSPDPGELLRANLGDLMGVAALPHHGQIGLLLGGRLQWTEVEAGGDAGTMPPPAIGAAVGTAVPQAAEQRALYGHARAAETAGPNASAHEAARGAASFVFDRSLARGAEAVAEYSGPAAGPFEPGDVLLLAYSDGYPGIRVLRRSGGLTAPGTGEMAVEPEAIFRPVTTGPRVVALLRHVWGSAPIPKQEL